MRELSLHILDLIENSIRAGASVISVTLAAEPERDLMKISIEDNGPGLAVAPARALDPFYTTKKGKRVGLGLSLFGAAAERAGGTLSVGRSRLGGAAVKATMQIHNVDRAPLGDLEATLTGVVATNPSLDLRCRLAVGKREFRIKLSDVEKELGGRDHNRLALARRLSDKVKADLADLNIEQYGF
jgi:signal transduction histidine kinase